MTTDHVDVLIVGAGLSGIGAAYYMQTRCQGKRYTILESRDHSCPSVTSVAGLLFAPRAASWCRRSAACACAWRTLAVGVSIDAAPQPAIQHQ